MRKQPHDLESRISVNIPVDEHKKLKALAAFNGITIKELVLDCLREHILGEKKPNDETLKAFIETDRREGLIECEDFEDFIKKMDL